MRHRMLRTCLVAACAVLLTPVLGVSAANAEAAPLFWGYFQWTDGEWQFASTGPDGATPEDGAVEGWRFAANSADLPPRPPRAEGDFEVICGSTPEPASGEKRVAVVIDYGLADEAPEGAEPPAARGDCAVVPEDATGADVMAAVAQVREQDSLVCGFDGYPASGCGTLEAEPMADADTPVELELPDASSGEADNESGGDGDGGTDNAADGSGVDSGAATGEAADDGIGRFGVLIAALIAVVVVGVLGGALGIRRRRGGSS